VSPPGGRGGGGVVREERSQREGESRSERLSVAEGVRMCSAGSSLLLVALLPNFIQNVDNTHTFQKFSEEILLLGEQGR